MPLTVHRLWQTGYWLFVATLCLSPLPRGSNRDWAWSPLAAFIGFIGILGAVGVARRHRQSPIVLNSLRPAVIALVAVAVWILVQTQIVPWSEAANPIVDDALRYGGIALHPRIAIRPEAAIDGLMRLLTYALAFWIVVDAARNIKQVRQILIAIVATGVAITIYAVLAEIASTLRGDFAAILPKIGADFTGTFVNRNNYATYAGLCALAAVTLIRVDAPVWRIGSESFGTSVRRVARHTTGVVVFHATAFVVLMGGVVLSESRAGIVSFALALFVSCMLGARRSSLAAAGFILVGLFLVILPGGERLLERFLELITYGSERGELYSLTISGISLRPWTGWGLGSFESVYSVLQPSTLALNFDKAHNTYLELALDLGIPFGLVLPIVVARVATRCVFGIRERARNQEIPALAISATILVGVHSLFDFSLQIPAVALLFTTILGIGWAQSWSSRR